jgi:WD40 repeat protein
VTSRLTVLEVAGTLRAWDVSENSTFDTAGPGASVQGLAPGIRIASPVWSPDGTRVILSNGNLSATVWALSAEGNQPTFTLAPTLERPCPNCPLQPDYILDASWSPDGTRIATAQFGYSVNIGVESDSRIGTLSGSNGSVRVWNGATGEQENLYGVAEGSPAFTSVAWSPDGARLAASSQGYTPDLGEQAERITPKIFIWDTATTGSLLLTLEGHDGDQISSLAWSHDGTRLLSAGDDGTARIWDTSDGTLLFTFPEHRHWVMSAAWSPDDSRIVTTSWDGRILVWDAQTGEVQTTFTRHTDWPNSAAWSPNGARILSASWDKSALIWDADTGDVVGSLEGHEDAVLGASWSPDGTQVITLSSDDTARLWKAWQSLDALKAEAASCCLVRDLTDDERALFGLAEEQTAGS